MVLAIVLVGVFMAVLDSIVVSIALPTITTSFGVDVARSQWAITAYMLTMTSLLLFFGRVSERTGRTVLFIAGFTMFTIASLACGLSATLAQLVGFRVLQAVGGSMVFSIGGAILFQAFPVEERGRAMGFLGSTVAVASVLGPIVGGMLVDQPGLALRLPGERAHRRRAGSPARCCSCAVPEDARGACWRWTGPEQGCSWRVPGLAHGLTLSLVSTGAIVPARDHHRAPQLLSAWCRRRRLSRASFDLRRLPLLELRLFRSGAFTEARWLR